MRNRHVGMLSDLSAVRILVAVCALVFTVGFSHPTEAALTKYSLNFTDKENPSYTGTGAFFWNTETELMTGLTWNFGGKVGAVKDEGLAKVYQSWNPLAKTYGALYYRFMTDSQGYLQARYNPLSISVGLMPVNVTGDFGFIAFKAERGIVNAGYRFLNPDWSVATEGYVSATPVPEPSTILLFGAGLLGLAALGRRQSYAR